MEDDDAKRAMEELDSKRERQKEHTYRKLYSGLLQKNKGIFDGTDTQGNEDYAEERGQLERVFSIERNSLMVGLAAGLMVFGSLRMGPKLLTQRFGGQQRRLAMEEAEEQAKKRGTEEIQKSIAVFIEGAFSIWVGYRGYDYASHQSQGSYETIAEIPLCKGRSRITDALCLEWVDVSTNQIPKAFWKILDQEEEGLRDEKTWRAIHQFSENCAKRLAEEYRIRKERGQANNEPVSLPDRVASGTSIDKASEPISVKDSARLARDA